MGGGEFTLGQCCVGGEVYETGRYEETRYPAVLNDIEDGRKTRWHADARACGVCVWGGVDIAHHPSTLCACFQAEPTRIAPGRNGGTQSFYGAWRVVWHVGFIGEEYALPSHFSMGALQSGGLTKQCDEHEGHLQRRRRHNCSPSARAPSLSPYASL